MHSHAAAPTTTTAFKTALINHAKIIEVRIKVNRPMWRVAPTPDPPPMVTRIKWDIVSCPSMAIQDKLNAPHHHPIGFYKKNNF